MSLGFPTEAAPAAVGFPEKQAMPVRFDPAQEFSTGAGVEPAEADTGSSVSSENPQGIRLG